jgi:hypothetical protein
VVVTDPRAENLAVNSSVFGCNVTSKERREGESGELELDTGCAALRPGHVTVTSRQWCSHSWVFCGARLVGTRGN